MVMNLCRRKVRKMICKELAKEVLDACLSTGADFAELYFEDTTKNLIQLNSKKVC